jgi:type I restriction enzyme S subunit
MTTKYVTESNLCLSDKSIKENQIPITRKGSLMFSFKLSIGKVAFASKDLFTNEAIVTLSTSKKYDLDYFYYYLPLVCDNNATENIYGAKMMNQKIIANMSFALPPLPEQRSIASYLDAECSKIDRAASIVEKEIDAYKRLKRSLINEVVTGKRTKF